MKFSARPTRLVVVSLLGLVLVGSCLFAGAKLWRRVQPSLQMGQQIATASGGERTSVKATEQANALSIGLGSDSASLIESLKRKRAKLAENRYDKPSEASSL